MIVSGLRTANTEYKAARIDLHLPARLRMAYASPGQKTRKEGAPG
jgi:hypothetical protein